MENHGEKLNSKISVPPKAIPSLFHGPTIRQTTTLSYQKFKPKPLKIS